MSPIEIEASDWPLRPWILAGLLAAAGLIVHLLTEQAPDRPLPVAAAGFVIAFGVALAFTLDRNRWRAPALFALAAGLIVGGLAYQTIRLEDRLAGEEYAFAAGLFAVALALPLFQAGFHRTRLATSYRLAHFHVWTDAVATGGAVIFTGLSWAMLFLLDGLFDLVDLHVIGELVDEEWFGFTWTGGAFGAALGVLRNNLKVLGALQSVVMIVMSLLAVPLALALIVFLVALIASGGQALWEATDSATPVLLVCAIGCFVLANSIVRDDDEARSRNRVMRTAVLVLSVGIFPLAIFAALSMGIRIQQYGLAPERIWALIAIAVASAYGLAYWVGLLRGRRAGWSDYLRRANLHLAAATCVIALILALPIVDFGAISARNQVARLEAGRVTPEEFDFAALRWDFGKAGRDRLQRLAKGQGKVADLASVALQQQTRPGYWERSQPVRRDFALRVQPEDAGLRELVLARLRAESWRCRERCVALDLGTDRRGTRRVALVEGGSFEVLPLGSNPAAPEPVRSPPEMPELKDHSEVEIRTVPTRYIFIDGIRVHGAVEERMEIAPLEVAPAAPVPAPPPPAPASSAVVVPSE